VDDRFLMRNGQPVSDLYGRINRSVWRESAVAQPFAKRLARKKL
jgi:hypothetical protein